MKKFRFTLETVKSYKENLLENLKGEYGMCMVAVQNKAEEIREMEQQQRNISGELNDRNSRGISANDIVNYQRYLHVLRSRIQNETVNLEELKRTAEAKKEEMIEAKKEVEIFLKLKEQQLGEYMKADAKAQEQFAEEFVTRGLVLQVGGR